MVNSMQINTNSLMDNKTAKINRSNFISFQGYKGLDYYGRRYDRQNLNYEIDLTPRGVSSLIDTSLTKDIGLKKAFNDLLLEAEYFMDAVKSLSEITVEFGKVAINRAAEIKKRNPSGSRIPILGIIPTVFRGEFNDQVWHDLSDVEEDWDEIKSNYKNNVATQNKDLNKSLVRLNNKVDLGLRSTRGDYRRAIGDLKKTTTDHWNLSQKKVITSMDDFMDSYVSNMYDAINRKQNRRAVTKGILIAVGGDFPGLDSIGDLLGDGIAELFSNVVDGTSDFFKIDIDSKLENFYDTLPDWIKPYDSAGFAADVGQDLLLPARGDTHISQEKFEGIFHDFLGNHKPAELMTNIEEFTKSLNMHHLNDFVRTSGDQIFTAAITGFSNTMLRNYEETGKVNIKGLWKDVIYNVVATPLAVVGDNAAAYWDHNPIHGIVLDTELKEAAQKIVGQIPGNITKKKIYKLCDHVIKEVPEYVIGILQGGVNDFFSDVITGKPVEERKLKETLKVMSDFFIEFSKQTDKLDDITKIMSKIK